MSTILLKRISLYQKRFKLSKIVQTEETISERVHTTKTTFLEHEQFNYTPHPTPNHTE